MFQIQLVLVAWRYLSAKKKKYKIIAIRSLIS